MLQLTNGGYTGEYHIKVFPYFFKNEKGRLDITVPAESRATVNSGKPAPITAVATASKSKHSFDIKAIVTPVDQDHGSLKLWFKAGEHDLTFMPEYHFDARANMTNGIAAQKN